MEEILEGSPATFELYVNHEPAEPSTMEIYGDIIRFKHDGVLVMELEHGHVNSAHNAHLYKDLRNILACLANYMHVSANQITEAELIDPMLKKIVGEPTPLERLGFRFGDEAVWPIDADAPLLDTFDELVEIPEYYSKQDKVLFTELVNFLRVMKVTRESTWRQVYEVLYDLSRNPKIRILPIFEERLRFLLQMQLGPEFDSMFFPGGASITAQVTRGKVDFIVPHQAIGAGRKSRHRKRTRRRKRLNNFR